VRGLGRFEEGGENGGFWRYASGKTKTNMERDSEVKHGKYGY